jgi:N-acyl homoserine lactone hydrolase
MKHAALIVGCLLAASYCGPGRVKKSEAAGNNGPVKVYALKYGESYYPSKLVNTASREKNIRLNWLAYLVKHSDGKYTLIDCGFSEPKLLQRFGIEKFRSVTEILAGLGITPDKIDTIILTHTHFDHALDARRFPRGRILVHQTEINTPQEEALEPVFAALKAQGRLQPVQVDTEASGLHLEPVMGHTPGSMVVRTQLAGKELIFTGDECYFAASCKAQIPLPAGAVFDSKANRRFIAAISAGAKILTGHETELSDGRWLNPYVFFFF